jgi:hypothetical protein
MFCDCCGTSLPQAARFCSNCGKSFVAAPPVVTAPRVARHIRTLGILWVVYSVLHMVPGLIVSSLPNWFGFNSDVPFFVPGVFHAVGGILLIKGLLGVIAGWGLLDRQSWARLLAIILGFISLIHVPFGTALGIYTLWVLLPGSSELEYRHLARP